MKYRACGPVHPVSTTRFHTYIYIYIYIYIYRLFGPSPWKILAATYDKKGFLSNPAPGDNLVGGNLVMETGCTVTTCYWPVMVFMRAETDAMPQEHMYDSEANKQTAKSRPL